MIFGVLLFFFAIIYMVMGMPVELSTITFAFFVSMVIALALIKGLDFTMKRIRMDPSFAHPFSTENNRLEAEDRARRLRRKQRGGANGPMLRSFEKRYGSGRGKKIYYAVLGKIHKDREHEGKS